MTVPLPPIVDVWRPGDPCRSCGSTMTGLDDCEVPRCHACGRDNADE